MFHGKFDTEDQAQGHEVSNFSETFKVINTKFKFEGEIPNDSKLPGSQGITQMPTTLMTEETRPTGLMLTCYTL